ncbi:MAG: hypothetical protein DWG76_07335 [Chloroflexi bacterium]|nr:hypothetical protein [Chloroflexota bacterium]
MSGKLAQSHLDWIHLSLLAALLAAAAGCGLRNQSAQAAIADSQRQPEANSLVDSNAGYDVDEVQGSSYVEAGGIQIEASNFRVEGDYFWADLCYDRPSQADWLLGTSRLELPDAAINSFALELIDYRTGSTSVGQRCDKVSFPIEKTTKLDSFRIVVPQLEISWPDRQDCDAAQIELDANNSGIAIRCVAEEGYSGYEVDAKPESLSDEELARQIQAAFQKSVGVREGPWVLEGSLP